MITPTNPDKPPQVQAVAAEEVTIAKFREVAEQTLQSAREHRRQTVQLSALSAETRRGKTPFPK